MSEQQPVNKDEKDTQLEDGSNENQNGQGESEAQKAKKEKLKQLLETDNLLDDALEAEILKLENAKLKKEDTIRKLRDEKREIKNAPIEVEDNKPAAQPPSEDVLVKRVKDSIFKETQNNNINLAKSQFYKTDFGKKFDPINDPDGQNWNRLKEFLVLRPTDVSVSDILKRYRAAAFAAEEDTIGDVSIEQERRNREKAEEALNDLGSGGTAGSANRNVGKDPSRVVLTEEQKARCRANGISEETYIGAIKKLKSSASKSFMEIKLS